MKPYVITIARQYGSGGKTVGKMLADKLGIPFYNREIITMASEDSGVNAMLFSDERLKGDFLTRLRAHYHGRQLQREAQQRRRYHHRPVWLDRRGLCPGELPEGQDRPLQGRHRVLQRSAVR